MKLVDRKSSVTVRIPNSLLDILDDMVEKKKYADRSEAIRSLTQNGIHLDKIIQLAKNPKKSKELVKKLKQLDSIKEIEDTLNTLEPHQLKLVEALAVDISSNKSKQMLLDMKE